MRAHVAKRPGARAADCALGCSGQLCSPASAAPNGRIPLRGLRTGRSCAARPQVGRRAAPRAEVGLRGVRFSRIGVVLQVRPCVYRRARSSLQKRRGRAEVERQHGAPRPTRGAASGDSSSVVRRLCETAAASLRLIVLYGTARGCAGGGVRRRCGVGTLGRRAGSAARVTAAHTRDGAHSGRSAVL